MPVPVTEAIMVRLYRVQLFVYKGALNIRGSACVPLSHTVSIWPRQLCTSHFSYITVHDNPVMHTTTHTHMWSQEPES